MNAFSSRKKKHEELAVAVQVLQNRKSWFILGCCFADDGWEMDQDSKRMCRTVVSLTWNLCFGEVLFEVTVVVFYTAPHNHKTAMIAFNSSHYFDSGFLFLLDKLPPLPPKNGDKPVRLLAKYSYKSNPSKPGGFDELTITQGEKLELCRAHPSNPHWWEARNENGEVGFVPATYMMVRSY